MSACRSCEAEILWGTTSGGKAMPLDAKPDAKGDWVLIKGQIQRATPDDDRLHRPRYTSHFATCPDHAGWRKSR